MTLQIQDPDRGTGRTTRRVIAYLHLLVGRPGEEVFIRDLNDSNGHRHVHRLVKQSLDLLGVSYTEDATELSLTVVPLVRSGEVANV